MSVRQAVRSVVRFGCAALLVGLLIPAWPVAMVQAACTYAVTNTNDSNNGSLRDAIDAVNRTGAPGTICFSISGGGVHTISPSRTFDYLRVPMTIDATTQPGYAGSPLIELDGRAVVGASGFTLFVGGNTIKGFAIYNFAGGSAAINIPSDGNVVQANYIGISAGAVVAPNTTGIYIAPSAQNGSHASNNTIGGPTAAARNVVSGNLEVGITIDATPGGTATGNVVQGNYVGVDPSGSVMLKNPNILGSSKQGISILAASNNTISGNLVSGCSTDGNSGAAIVLVGKNGPTTNNVVQGNLVGVDVTGNKAIPNTAGIYLDTASQNTIGGTTAATRNVVSGSLTIGITVDGSFRDATGNSAINNVIQGNYVGTNAAGTAAIPNVAGVDITAANYNTIGGLNPGAGNLISGNSNAGVVIEGFEDIHFTTAVATGNLLYGNLIGTNAAGTAGIGNKTGISIVGANGNSVGSTIPAARNVIAGFASPGIGILVTTDARTTGQGKNNTISGNFIGTDITGTSAITSSGYGISFESANSNTVGGLTLGEANTIAFLSNGIVVHNSMSDAILKNSIFSNTVGISLDTGNNAQAAPTLQQAHVTGANQITVVGFLNVAADAGHYHVEFFAIPTNVAQGKTPLGSAELDAGAFSAQITAAPVGQFVTAIATRNSTRDSSAFSNAVVIATNLTANPGTTPQQAPLQTAFAPLSVTVTDDSGNPRSGAQVIFTAPSSGPSGTFATGGTTATVATGADGVATAPTFTANGTVGQYQVVATVAGISATATFTLTNFFSPLPIRKPSGTSSGPVTPLPAARLPDSVQGGSPNALPPPRP